MKGFKKKKKFIRYSVSCREWLRISSYKGKKKKKLKCNHLPIKTTKKKSCFFFLVVVVVEVKAFTIVVLKKFSF